MAAHAPHVQVKFCTKLKNYAIPESAYSIPGSLDIGSLNSLVNSTLKQQGILSDGDADVEFDFLIHNEFLRSSVLAFMEEKAISTEDVVPIEYVLHQQAPEPEHSLPHNDWVSCVQANSKHLLTGSYDCTLRLWLIDDISRGGLVTIPAHSQEVKCVAWIKSSDEPSAESTFVSGSHDQSLRVWSWNGKKKSVTCLCRCAGHSESVDCVAVDATQTKLVSGSWDKMLKLWSLVDGEGEMVEGAEAPKKKKVDSLPVKVPVMTLSGHGEAVSSVQWIGNDRVASASWDHSMRLWDVAVGEQLRTFTGSKVFFSMDYNHSSGQVVTGSSDRHVRLWDFRKQDGALVVGTFTSHTGWVSSVRWCSSNDNLFMSGSYDGTTKLWDCRSPKAPLYDMMGHTDKVLSVDCSHPTFMFSGGADSDVKMFRYAAA